MKKSDGFSLVEVIIAMGIIVMLVATALPIHQLLKMEHYRIKQHQLIKLALHDELQEVLHNNEAVRTYTFEVTAREVQVTFQMEGKYVKGCAEWRNVRDKDEQVCLYGIYEK